MSPHVPEVGELLPAEGARCMSPMFPHVGDEVAAVSVLGATDVADVRAGCGKRKIL